MRTWLWQAMAAVAAISAASAGAQLFKCKGPDGKIVYSDTKCEASATGDAIKVVPMATTKSEREKAMEEAEAAKADLDKKAAEKAAERRALAKEIAEEMRGGAPSGGAVAAEPYQLTASDREKIRELETTAGTLAAHAEQREAAQMHIARIKRGAEAKMTSSQRAARDNLVHDLASANPETRKRAMSELRSNYR